MPAPYTCTTVPLMVGGHMILWAFISLFSRTTPKMSPPVMGSPTRNDTGVYSHFLLWSSGATSMPRGTNGDLASSEMASSGRWMPSKMLPMMPGPSSTDSGCPRRSTGSPTVRPAARTLA